MFIRTKDGIIDTDNTNKCIYVIRDNSIKKSEFRYVSYLWDNWREYFLIDYQNCALFSYNSAQIFISDLMKENLKYQNLVIELSPYYKDYNQSDNLAELIDGYYVQINDWIFDITHLFDNLEEVIKDFEDWKSYSNRKYLDYEISIYAFIKTDKGLIYVAKIIDGELALI